MRDRRQSNRLPPSALGDLPADSPACGHAPHDRRAREGDAQPVAMRRANQVERARPVRRGRPRKPKLRDPLLKTALALRRMSAVDAKKRIQGLDFEIELLHERDGYAAQLWRS